jgi:hypothetical protein
VNVAECERAGKCIFFNDRMETMPSTVENYKRIYCMGRFEDCARRKVAKALSPERVPLNLYPNEESRAEKIIAEG